MRFEGVFTGGTASELMSTRHLSSKSVRERVLGKWHVICFISCQGLGLFPEQFIVGLRFYVDRGVLPADLSRTENCKYVIAAFSCFYAATSLACTSNLAQTGLAWQFDNAWLLPVLSARLVGWLHRKNTVTEPLKLYSN